MHRQPVVPKEVRVGLRDRVQVCLRRSQTVQVLPNLEQQQMQMLIQYRSHLYRHQRLSMRTFKLLWMCLCLSGLAGQVSSSSLAASPYIVY